MQRRIKKLVTILYSIWLILSVGFVVQIGVLLLYEHSKDIFAIKYVYQLAGLALSVPISQKLLIE